MNSRKRKRLDDEPLQSSSKAVKKAFKQDASEPEKRGAIFKKRCPKNIMERVDRVMSQRFFLLSRSREEDELREEFKVLGSTGNVYTVFIDKIPSCNCPDALKGNHCKHLLFVFLKVLQVPTDSHCWYQKALLTSELKNIFAHAPAAPNSRANRHVIEAYSRSTGQASSSKTTTAPQNNRRIPGAEDNCPICYESMPDVKTLTFCDVCGNALHDECFRQWARKAGHNVTCVWCRAQWVSNVPSNAAGAVKMSPEGYINLSTVAGISPIRDTSSYYHGHGKWRNYY